MKKQIILALMVVAGFVTMSAGDITLGYEAGAEVNVSTGDFAPAHLSSNRSGTLTQKNSLLVHGKVFHDLDTTRRLSWGAGVQLWAGAASANDYWRVTPGEKYPLADAAAQPAGEHVTRHPARAWLQEVYVTGKYRAVFVTIGGKERYSSWLNRRLSSGDLVMSGNARPGYGATAGFVNFQNIPLTRGNVQIKGEVGYYRLGDGKWLEDHYNYARNFITTGYWLNYKNIYFRSNPSKRVVFTLGMQAACQFGGTMSEYATAVFDDENGRYAVSRLEKTTAMKAGAKAFFKALIPGSGGNSVADEDYYEGNHLGSWDVSIEYKPAAGKSIKAYYQSPFEDGSGIGKKNGFDGLWGLEYHADGKGVITGAVAEYLDLTNQSGPLHFNPYDYRDADRPGGSPLTGEATGSDDYYNNYAYNGYQNRGLSIGSPLVKSPLYHLDGYMRYFDNRVRGFHLAAEGNATATLTYRAMFTWRKSWGNIFMPRLEPATLTSCSLEGIYALRGVDGLKFHLQLALDHGSLYSGTATDNGSRRANFGVLLGVTFCR